jgi:hypothetical protein
VLRADFSTGRADGGPALVAGGMRRLSCAFEEVRE